MILDLDLDPAAITTAQQKGERVVRGFIMHYIKPEVVRSNERIRAAIIKAIKANYPDGSKQIVTEEKIVGWRDKWHKIPIKREFVGSVLKFEKGLPLSVSISYRFKALASASKKERAVPHWHATRPDADNLTKSLLDVFTEIGLWEDDAQVSELTIEKIRLKEGESPNVRVVIKMPEDLGIPI